MNKRLKALTGAIVAALLIGGALFAISSFLIKADVLRSGISDYGNIPSSGSLAKGTTKITKSGTVYTFSFTGDENISYTFDTQDENNKKGLLAVKAKLNSKEFYPLSIAGPTYSNASGEQGGTLGTTSFSDQITNDSSGQALVITYNDQINSTVSRARTTKIQPKGKSLVVTFNSQGPAGTQTALVEAANNYRGLSLGPPSGTTNLKAIEIPYMPDVPIVQVENTFMSAYIDKTQSHAAELLKPVVTSFTPEAVAYRKDADGKISNFSEVAYLTVSSKIEDVFPYPNNPPIQRPKRKNQISGLFVVNNKFPNKVAPKDSSEDADEEEAPSCQTQPAAPTAENPAAQLPIPVSGENFSQYYFNNTKVFLEMINQMGISNIIYVGTTNWGQSPGSELTPKRLPICERAGGEAQYQQLIQTAKQLGIYFIDHEGWFAIAKKYVDNSQSADYDKTLAFYTTKMSDNHYAPHGRGENRPTYSVSPDGLPSIAKATIDKLAGGMGLNGTFLDTLPSFAPTRLGNINLGSENKNSRNLAQSIVNMKKFFVYLNQNFVGPIVGEGGKGWERIDSYYAGYIDGVEREHDSHKEGAIIPDFELKNVAPKSPLNYGMGWLERWECQGSGGAKENKEFGGDEKQCVAKFDSFDFDRYRAQTISFGHPAFLPDVMNLNIRDANNFHKYLRRFTGEYYLVQQLQSQYIGTPISSIEYFDSNGKIGDLSTVYKTKPNYDFKASKIRLAYVNGLIILVNNDQGQNWAISTEVGNYTLSPNGFVAYNKNIKGWEGSGNFLAYSAVVNGRRVDYVSSQKYSYNNDRGPVENVQADKTLAASSASSSSDTGVGLKAINSDGLEVICTGEKDAPKCEVTNLATATPTASVAQTAPSPTPTPTPASAQSAAAATTLTPASDETTAPNPSPTPTTRIISFTRQPNSASLTGSKLNVSGIKSGIPIPVLIGIIALVGGIATYFIFAKKED